MYQLNLKRGPAVPVDRELSSGQKHFKQELPLKEEGVKKAVGFIPIHTHNLKEEFSGQNYQARDKVVFLQVSDHQPCTPRIFTVAVRIPGRFHTDTSEFPF